MCLKAFLFGFAGIIDLHISNILSPYLELMFTAAIF